VVLMLLALVALFVRPALAEAPSRAQAIADAITELDVERARTLLEKADAGSVTLAFERARLAIYLGDCDTAAAILAAPDFSTTPEGSGLLELAQSCARATAGSVTIQDEKAGVWLRLQDEADRVLSPFIIEVAVEARRQIERDLGVVLPRPVRIVGGVGLAGDSGGNHRDRRRRSLGACHDHQPKSDAARVPVGGHDGSRARASRTVASDARPSAALVAGGCCQTGRDALAQATPFRRDAIS
jgi:hypothetical protein